MKNNRYAVVLLKKILRKLYYLLPTLISKLKFRFMNVAYGPGLEVKGSLFVRASGSITIGRNVRINSSPESNPIGGGEKTFLRAFEGATIIIGDRVGLSNCAITSQQKIVIEDDVLIGAGVGIFDTNFHSTSYEDRIQRRETSDINVASSPVLIKRGAFIGTRSLVLKGVVVGEGAVIAAGSVVTKSIPDGEVWGGNPARYLRGGATMSGKSRKDER